VSGDDPEEWTDEDTAPVPARVFQKRSLGIDNALSSRIKSARAPRIRSHLVDYVVPIGRRALEVAIKEAVSQKELNPHLSEWEPEWSRIANASQDAGAALARLFSAIDPLGKDAEHFVRFIRQSRLGGVGASKALRDARLLVGAKQIIGKLRAELKNPFLRAVDAAWIDWRQEDSSDAEAFGEALDAAISSIDKAKLNWLRAAGPRWVRP
jgi:hypothetical protein